MTPRDVDHLSDAEYRAFWQYFEDEIRETERQARRARRGR